VVGSATVQEIFNVSVGKSGSKVAVAGSRILTGELHASYKYRLVRDEEVIADNLTLSSLKHHKKNVSLLDKGSECGISFNNFHETILKGDMIECYVDKKAEEFMFDMKAGVISSF